MGDLGVLGEQHQHSDRAGRPYTEGGAVPICGLRAQDRAIRNYAIDIEQAHAKKGRPY